MRYADDWGLFLFQIGSIKSALQLPDPSASVAFLFQIGSIKSFSHRVPI